MPIMLKILFTTLLCCAAFHAQDFLRDVQVGNSSFEVVEIAKTDAARAKGLGGRDYLPDSNAMLFIMGTPGPCTFWMKDTLVPLDAVFMDATGKILSIQTMPVEPPQSAKETKAGYERRLKRYSCKGMVFSVLEMRAGLAAELGLEKGMRVAAFAASRLI